MVPLRPPSTTWPVTAIADRGSRIADSSWILYAGQVSLQPQISTMRRSAA